MSSRIEQIIEELEDYIDGCKYQALSNTKIIVEKEHIDELLRELRMKTPDEIKRYQKIISNKEAILRDAKEKADALINTAQIQTDHMINEHEIMQQAYEQANEVVVQAAAQAQQILDNATIEANGVRTAAMQYMDDMLVELQNIISHAIGTAEAKYGDLIQQLKECDSVITANRSELYPQIGLEKDIAEGNLPTPESIIANTDLAGNAESGDDINLDMLKK
ncbi:MAG TPA: vacuolar family H+-ATPase subunit H [Lachnospiraceae bacterium]|nr:vacuolar family H+-ATPase subunit H [Lachnospiraceae bacterium]